MQLGKGAPLLVAALIVVLIWPAPPAFSAEQGVRIAASKTGSYDLESQVFTAEGDVEVHVDGLMLLGSVLRADLAEGLVTLEGDVRLIQDGQEIRGAFLVYNLNTGEGSFEEVRAELAVPDGTVYASGRLILFDQEQYSIAQAAFTTCDLEQSHYRLVTKEMEFIPGDKAIIRHVVYYEGQIPLFYWPYLVVPLGRDLEDLLVSLPVVGYGDYEGYFIKSAFNYFFTENSYGNLYVDLYTRLGLGAGVKHHYKLQELGQGHLYLWGVPTAAEKHYKAAWEHSLTKDSWTFATKNSVEKTWLKDEISSDTALHVSAGDLKGKLWLTYKKNPQATTKGETSAGMQWSKPLGDRLTLNVEGSYAQKRTTEEVRLMNYLLAAVYNQGKHRLTLTMEQQFNPDLLDTGTKDWRSLQRRPELKWEIGDLGLNSLPLQGQLVLGHYEETPSMVIQSRGYGQVALRARTWRPRAGTSLTYQGDLNGAVYSDGSSQAWLYGRVSLNQNLGKHLSFSSTYRRRDVWGSTPFKFDAQGKLEDLSLRLSYSRGNARGYASTVYDFVNKRFSTLTLNAYLKPSERWTLDLYASYDLNTRSWTRLVPMAEYKHDQFSLKLGLRYRPPSRELERVDLRFSLPVGSAWKVSYDSIYAPAAQQFTKGQITISRDLHCRQLGFSYDHVAGRFAVQLTINAFPALPIGWDSQGGLSLFDLEDVADIIDVKE